MERFGIDVSENNGVINWNMVKSSGVEFAILRTVKKSLVADRTFEANYKGCKDNHIKVGGYKYSYAVSEAAALHEAEAVLRLLNGRKLDLPIYLDLEDEVQRKLSKNTLTKIANTFLNKIRSAGYKAEIYCNLDWYQNVLDTAAIETDGYWIARYGKNNGTADISFKPNIGEVMWQFTSKGTVPGIKGAVDLNYLFKEYESAGQEQTELPQDTVPVQTIRSGDRGAYVKMGQALLSLKYNIGSAGADGIFGTNTEKAVRAFQKDSGITEDGVIGVRTWSKLLSVKHRTIEVKEIF